MVDMCTRKSLKLVIVHILNLKSCKNIKHFCWKPVQHTSLSCSFSKKELSGTYLIIRSSSSHSFLYSFAKKKRKNGSQTEAGLHWSHESADTATFTDKGHHIRKLHSQCLAPVNLLQKKKNSAHFKLKQGFSCSIFQTLWLVSGWCYVVSWEEKRQERISCW